MTTYTLTTGQLHNLMALIYDSVSTNPKWIADRENAAQMLRSLQPNTQEPVDIARVDAAMVEMRDIVPPLRRSECERLISAALSAHPAPQPTEPRMDIAFGGPKAREQMLNQLVHPAPQPKPLNDYECSRILRSLPVVSEDQTWSEHLVNWILTQGVKP